MAAPNDLSGEGESCPASLDASGAWRLAVAAESAEEVVVQLGAAEAAAAAGDDDSARRRCSSASAHGGPQEEGISSSAAATSLGVEDAAWAAEGSRVCVICFDGEPPLLVEMPCRCARAYEAIDGEPSQNGADVLPVALLLLLRRCRGTVGLIHKHCLSKLVEHTAVCTACKKPLVPPCKLFLLTKWRKIRACCALIDRRWLYVYLGSLAVVLAISSGLLFSL